MALLSILHYPDQRLHRKALPITEINQEIKDLVNDMTETMYHNNGIGLAATQVNVLKRLFIMDFSKNEQPKQLQVLINPEIIKREGEAEYEEGCLSVPGVFETVKRAEKITVIFQSLDGKQHKLNCDGLLAICIQHELDHLDGKVFVDYLSSLKQNVIKRKMRKLFKDE